MSIFTFVAGQIEEQISTFRNQGSQTEQVVNIIKKGFSPITGGAWIGLGSQAYQGEITGKVIPQTMELIAAIAGFGGNLGSALNIMNVADKAVSGIVGQVGDIFDAIF
jgi:uncharacterized protein YukE